jgi:ferredoxin
MPYVVTEECILCGACVAGCDNEAITEGETRAIIDTDKCIECGTCEMNCPSGAMIYVDEAEAARIMAQIKGQATSPPPP